MSMKEMACKFCGKKFYAKRSDAIRCRECHSKRIKEHQSSPRGKALRAAGYRKLRETAIIGYGGKCQCCNENRFEFLAIDHVNGGGVKERKTKAISQILRKVVVNEFPPEYRILCHNCNSSIGFYGYCPHNKRTA